MNTLFRSLFPLHCLHCREISSHWLCSNCSPLLELIDSKFRCRVCFGTTNLVARDLCHGCYHARYAIGNTAAALSGHPLGLELLGRLERGSLLRGSAALLAAQFLALKWPMPDRLLFPPRPFLHRFRGESIDQKLAHALSKILDRPVVPWLSARVAPLGSKLDAGGLEYRSRKLPLEGETLLIVQAVHSLEIVSACAKVLPSCRVYALALVKRGG